MKLFFNLVIILFFISCSPKIQILDYQDEDYGTKEIELSLMKFKTKETKIYTLESNIKYIKEFKRIKKHVLEKNVDEFLKGVYNYAIVLNKDTLYTNVLYSKSSESKGIMRVWNYKSKFYFVESKIFNDSLIKF